MREMKQLTEIMRPLHDMITRSTAETMDQIEFRSTHEKDLCEKEMKLTKLEEKLEHYFQNETLLPLQEKNQMLESTKQLTNQWVYTYW